MCVYRHPTPTPSMHTDAPWPGWGFTHTQFSADSGIPDAVDRARAAVAAVPMVQAQAIMGWGVDNPEPAPGRYDFRSLDRRMDFIRRSGGTPVIVLCCAPDWMRGGEPGQTDWSRLEVAPSSAHFADFAELAAQVAKRYPDVRYFVVWNEFKGFYDDRRGQWDAAGYTAMYNLVYDAVKAVNPANRVGGPYLDFASIAPDAPGGSPLRGPWGAIDRRNLEAFDYWNRHRRGADFVAVDAHASTAQGSPDEFTAVQKFAAVGRWLRIHTDLPVWWLEWYVEPTRPGWTSQHQIAVRVAAMIELAAGGADTALYWNPKPGDALCVDCLWTDTWSSTGGQPLTMLDVLGRFVRWFPPSVERRETFVADGLLALATARAQVIVNITDHPISAMVSGQPMVWAPYETRWLTSGQSSGQ
ncbi:xylan 1,4-beta-xylosidase [Gordonia sp. TBRC 11910]|uniref:Xylan 1,4-beta-xylosidase n=2 Tax=Gordonia asplenii TaxID=2725283 RepID=A0A848KPI6_9ACTN|nr:xylan 1,4-beta-xylosidase [Gordonia asplenii]